MPCFVGTGLLQRQGPRALLLLRSVGPLLEPRALLPHYKTLEHSALDASLYLLVRLPPQNPVDLGGPAAGRRWPMAQLAPIRLRRRRRAPVPAGGATTFVVEAQLPPRVHALHGDQR